MKKEMFREYLDVYSADLSRWPQDSVKPALALVGADAEAKAMFDKALALDDLMRVPAAPANYAALEDKIMARIAATAQEKTAPVVMPVAASALRPAWLFAPGGGLLAAVILGFFFGADMQVAQADYLLDPVYYSQEQIIGDDADIMMGEVF